MIAWYASNVTVIQNCLIAVLLAMSVQVTMRIGVLSLAGVGFYGISSYSTAILVKNEIASPEIAILLSILGCGVLSFFLTFLLSRVRGLYLAMVTLAFVLILNVVATNGGELTGGANGLYGVPFAVTTWHIVIICALGVAAVLLTERGRIGRANEALRTDTLLATSMGIRASTYRRGNLALSGALGGAAGALNVLNLGAVGPFDAGFTLAVVTLTMVVVGGRRSWVGSVIGAVLITVLPTMLSFLEGEFRHVATGLLVILMATYAPDGILGLGTSLYRRISSRKSGPSGPHRKAQPAEEDQNVDSLTV